MARIISKKSKQKKNITYGSVCITCTFNNTMITVTDLQGNVLAWSSSGNSGFKGSKKSTPYAAQVAAEDAARKAQENGLKSVEVLVKGPGSGRETAIRALHSSGLAISSIRDITPVPHNGCRPAKRRRI